MIVTGVDDDDTDGQRPYIVWMNPESSDPQYDHCQAHVSLSNLDDDGPGISIVPSGRLVTSEDGDQTTFQVHLNKAPSGDVTIDVTSSKGAVGEVSPSELNFDTVAWGEPRTVTVTGVNDLSGKSDPRGYTEYSVSVDVRPQGTNYDGVESEARVFNLDNDATEPGIRVIPDETMFTRESGASATFAVVLTQEPTDDVSVSVHSSNLMEGRVASGNLLTFTESDWNVPQEVIVTGVDDADDSLEDLQRSYTISLDAASSDGDFDNLDAQILLANLDNDRHGVAAVPSTVVTTEYLDTATFQVLLTRQPEHDVSVTASVAPGGETEVEVLTGSPLTFTKGDWEVPKAVIVRGKDDTERDGHQPYRVSLTTASHDPRFNSLQSTVNGINRDNDAGIVVMPTQGLFTSESGAAAKFTVELTMEPVGEVTIQVSVKQNGDDPPEGLLSKDGSIPAPSIDISFDVDNWFIPLEIVVTGQDDGDSTDKDGFTPYTIEVACKTAPNDPDFTTLPTIDVSVQNFDNDDTDPDVKTFMQSFTWWALKSQRDMAINEPLTNVMHLGGHNAFNNVRDGFAEVPWTNPNQIYRMTDQLDAGVRVLDIDFWRLNGDVYLRHGENDNSWNPLGIDRRRLEDALDEDLVPWVKAHPDEVIILVIEDKYPDDRDWEWVNMLEEKFTFEDSHEPRLQWMSFKNPDYDPDDPASGPESYPNRVLFSDSDPEVFKSRKELLDRVDSEGRTAPVQVIAGFFRDFWGKGEDASLFGIESTNKFTEVRGDGFIDYIPGLQLIHYLADWYLGNPPVTKSDLQEYARENVNVIAMDFILGREGKHSFPHSIGTPYPLHSGANAESDVPLYEYTPVPIFIPFPPWVIPVVGPNLYDLPTKHGDPRGDRLAAAVWSWKENDPGPLRGKHLEDEDSGAIPDDEHKEKDVAVQEKIDVGQDDGRHWVSKKAKVDDANYPNGYAFALRSVKPENGNYEWKLSKKTYKNWFDFRDVPPAELHDDDDGEPDWVFAQGERRLSVVQPKYLR